MIGVGGGKRSEEAFLIVSSLGSEQAENEKNPKKMQI